MKYLLYILLYLPQFIFSQDLEIVYEHRETFPQDTNLSDDEVVDHFSLILNDSKTLLKADSIIYLRNNTSDNTSYFFKNLIYKDHSKDIKIQVSGRYKDGWGYKTRISENRQSSAHQWKKTGKERIILGLKCIEVSHNDRTAWYTPEIPIPDGPAFTNLNLPGLVLEYKNSITHWKAINISKTNRKINFPKVKTTNNENSIIAFSIPSKKLSRKKAIITTSDTPINTWLKFDND